MKKEEQDDGVEISRCAWNDVFAVTKLWWKMVEEIATPEMLKEFDGKQKERYFLLMIQRIYNPDFSVFVAKKGDRLVGYMEGYIEQDMYSGKIYGFIESNYVAPDYRNKGVSHKLAMHIVESFRPRGCTYLRFHVMAKDNLPEVWKRKAVPHTSVFTYHFKERGHGIRRG